jgi:3-deoxy-D-manno-octulosonic-acid transferase
LLLAATPWLTWKSAKTGKYRRDWSGRLGWGPILPPHSARIWIHGVSVGETRAAEPLVRALHKKAPEAETVFSATTDTGLAMAQKIWGAERTFRFPLDFSGPVRRTFDRVGPRLLVLMELEVWPNLTAEAVKRDIPVIVANARITARSAGRYRLAWPLVGPAFQRVRLWAVQSEEYGRRLRELGVDPRRIVSAGNLKYDAVPAEPISVETRGKIRAECGFADHEKIVIGGSTHPGEEQALLNACRALLPRHPALRLILVPRHPERFAAAADEITAAGFACLRLSRLRAEKQTISAKAPVLLADVMGELNRLYSTADLAFVGGSLIPHGGQNVMEPAGLGLPVIFGPYTHNFAEAVAVLKSAGGAVEVPAATELPFALDRLLNHPDEARAMGAKAREALRVRQGGASATAAYLARLLANREIP